MIDFAYARASSSDEAVSTLTTPGTAIIAGGTELLNWMRLGIAEPPRLVDIGGAGLDGIALHGDTLTIGARATLNAVGEHPDVVARAAVLAQACLAAASPQVRNRATLGGNVLQKTRCPYFRAEHPLSWGCNKRIPGSGCDAIEGVNDRLAIFGWTRECAATQPSDPAVALTCLDAEAEVLGPAGPRRIPMTAFHRTQEEATAAGLDPAQAETQLRSDELIVAYHVPLRAGERSAYIKVRERASYEYALVSAGATVTAREGRIEDARIALGSVAQKPWRLRAAEDRLRGVRAVREAIAPIVGAAFGDARALSDNAYKITLAASAATRALLAALETA